jgi:NADPH-dependent curcumin reductase CurA
MPSSFISIQPYRPGWQEPEPSHVTGMALAHCILGKYLGVVCKNMPYINEKNFYKISNTSQAKRTVSLHTVLIYFNTF